MGIDALIIDMLLSITAAFCHAQSFMGIWFHVKLGEICSTDEVLKGLVISTDNKNGIQNYYVTT